MSIYTELKNTIKYPTSLILRGVDQVGIELARSLLEQGGFVILIDYVNEFTIDQVKSLRKYNLFSFYDFSILPELEETIRRLDYVFFLNHKSEDLTNEISSKEFLEFSSFLDSVLNLALKFEAKFLATTSIKAHQYLLANNNLDVAIDKTSEIHTVYNQSEIQRYVESLSFEYVQKSSLDLRILRLGEIIGECDVSYDSTVYRLIKEALEDDQITIFGDGLQSSFYVHILDAVYGIIKAQFTKNTRAEIFSLAYENEISDLSIAYKLNEFIENPKEIKFAGEQKNDNFGIRLYKPAVNLTRIGWKPRIKFERALQQSLSYSQQLLIQHEEIIKQQNLQKNPKTKAKAKGSFFKKFFYKTSQEDIEPKQIEETNQEYGALGRLIAERKIQEKGRQGSIVIANQQLNKKLKKQEVNLSMGEQIGNFINKKFDAFTNKYNFLRYMTLSQFFSYFAVFVVLLLIYVNFLAPTISFSKNVFLSTYYLKQIQETDFESGKKEISINYSEIVKELEEGREQLVKFEYLFEYTPVLTSFFEKYNQVYNDISLFTQGLLDTYQATKYIDSYIQDFKPQIVYRPSSSSLLAVENIQEHSGVISNININNSLAKNGVEQMSYSIDSMKMKNFDSQSQLQKLWMDFIDTSDAQFQNYSYFSKLGLILPRYVGVNDARNYAFILVDNTNYLPAGGYPVGMVVITFEQGAIRHISTKTFFEDSYETTVEDPFLINEINLVNRNFIDQQQNEINDVFYLQKGDLYLDELARLIEKKEEIQIHGVYVMNLNFLQKLLDGSEPIEFQNIKYDSNNLLVNTNLILEGGDNTYEDKKNILMNLFVISLQAYLNNFDSKIGKLIDIVEESISRKDLIYKNYSNSIPNYTSGSDSSIDYYSDFASIVFVSNPSTEFQAEIGSVNLVLNIILNADLSSRKSITINKSNLKNFESLAICLPNNTSNFSFREGDIYIKSERFGEFTTCVNFSSIDSDEIFLSYDSPSTEFMDEEYDYSFQLRKQPGFGINYSLDIYSEQANVQKASDKASVNANKAVFTGELLQDTEFAVKLENF